MTMAKATSCTQQAGISALLALPEALLREVVSWSPNGATTNVLLSACHDLHRLRRDPAAAALLLMRCPCHNYQAALTSCGSAGVGAVGRQLLQLAKADPRSGGPHAVPAALLNAMLCYAASANDAAAVHGLLALPDPPDINHDGGRALHCALRAGAPWAALAALLEVVAGLRLEVCTDNVFGQAAQCPRHLGALQLLLDHCPAADVPSAVDAALCRAARWDNAPAAQLLLPLLRPLSSAAIRDPLFHDVPALCRLASQAGGAGVLEVLLAHRPLSASDLGTCLVQAATFGRAECVVLLLDHGADIVAFGPPALREAIAILHSEIFEAFESLQRDVVALLLERGAVVTPEVRAAAEDAGLSYWFPPVQHGIVAAIDSAAAAGAPAAAVDNDGRVDVDAPAVAVE